MMSYDDVPSSSSMVGVSDGDSISSVSGSTSMSPKELRMLKRNPKKYLAFLTEQNKLKSALLAARAIEEERALLEGDPSELERLRREASWISDGHTTKFGLLSHVEPLYSPPHSRSPSPPTRSTTRKERVRRKAPMSQFDRSPTMAGQRTKRNTHQMNEKDSMSQDDEEDTPLESTPHAMNGDHDYASDEYDDEDDTGEYDDDVDDNDNDNVEAAENTVEYVEEYTAVAPQVATVSPTSFARSRPSLGDSTPVVSSFDSTVMLEPVVAPSEPPPEPRAVATSGRSSTRTTRGMPSQQEMAEMRRLMAEHQRLEQLEAAMNAQAAARQRYKGYNNNTNEESKEPTNYIARGNIFSSAQLASSLADSGDRHRMVDSIDSLGLTSHVDGDDDHDSSDPDSNLDRNIRDRFVGGQLTGRRRRATATPRPGHYREESNEPVSTTSRISASTEASNMYTNSTPVTPVPVDTHHSSFSFGDLPPPPPDSPDLTPPTSHRGPSTGNSSGAPVAPSRAPPSRPPPPTPRTAAGAGPAPPTRPPPSRPPPATPAPSTFQPSGALTARPYNQQDEIHLYPLPPPPSSSSSNGIDDEERKRDIGDEDARYKLIFIDGDFGRYSFFSESTNGGVVGPSSIGLSPHHHHHRTLPSPSTPLPPHTSRVATDRLRRFDRPIWSNEPILPIRVAAAASSSSPSPPPVPNKPPPPTPRTLVADEPPPTPSDGFETPRTARREMLTQYRTVTATTATQPPKNTIAVADRTNATTTARGTPTNEQADESSNCAIS